MSTFSGLNTALSGLNAARRGMDVTGRNIANANTDGYSRQRVNFQARGASVVPAVHSVSQGDGGGVDAASVDRLRDMMLEARAHTQHGRQQDLATQKDVLAGVEQAFGEPGSTGIQSQLGDFWNGWHDVANSPGDLAARSQLLQRAATVAEGFTQVAGALDTSWQGNHRKLTTVVDEVNVAAANIGELNQAIQRAEMAGLPAAELADQRDLLVVKLADLVGATTRPAANGAVDVFIGGNALVRGAVSQSVRLGGSTDMTGTATSPVVLQWPMDGSAVAGLGGTAAGLTDSLNTTLPGYRGRLDTVAASLIGSVNSLHEAGYDLAGDNGAPLFTGTGAGDIALALTEPAKVAASSTAGGNLDGTNAIALADLARATGGPDLAYRRLVVDLGVETQAVNRRVEIQTVVTSRLDADRQAESGVDLDEEMTNLIQFQHAYSGAARLMTAVDQAIDTLINRTGLVGR
jgi:flagellar hook-associated protein 1